jgi:hypothetical protein
MRGGMQIDAKTGKRVVSTPKERLTPQQIKENDDYWMKMSDDGPRGYWPHYTLVDRDGKYEDIHTGLGRRRRRR